MSAPAVSVIVVSLNRPDALCRCLTGIEQLDHPRFEVIVVADPAGLEALDRLGLLERVKSHAFNTPNISMARNHGLAMAAGEIVAFIDDDAVPEPTWLRFLAGAMQDRNAAAAGGYVIGRNGISLQYAARTVDRFGVHAPLAIEGDAARLIRPPEGAAVKTEGTNCAFRRDVLLKLGGFDPAFAFYMDETDLNLRLARAGVDTVVAPLAQVHHGFSASDRRRADRMPTTLFDIGASQVVLLRKHAAGHPTGTVLDAVRREQRDRLIRHLVAGTCEPRDVGRLMATLEDGFGEGEIRPLGPLSPLGSSALPLMPFEPRTRFRASGVLAGRPWSARRLRRAARGHVADGGRTTLFLFSPTAFYHRVRFTADGVWEQTGGLFGKSERGQRTVRLTSFARRVAEETARVARVRDLPDGSIGSQG